MSLSPNAENKRSINRLPRQPEHSWQLKIEDDMLITKNISNISPAGLSFKAPLSANFKKGQILRMNMSIQKGDSFDCEGEIVWALEAIEANGSMRQLGVRFSKLPARIDTSIMQEINSFVLREKRLSLESGQVPEFHKPRVKEGKTLRSLIITACGILVLIATTAALITAIYIHQMTHPENSIEYQFNKALLKKVLNSK